MELLRETVSGLEYRIGLMHSEIERARSLWKDEYDNQVREYDGLSLHVHRLEGQLEEAKATEIWLRTELAQERFQAAGVAG